MDTTKLKNKLSDSTVIKKSSAYYEQHKRWLPLISFFAGFSWDSITLNRIDRISDNLIMLLYIVLLGAVIMLSHLVDNETIKQKKVIRYRKWFPAAIQFFFGSLFSSYVVFYFQSASLSRNWLFMIFLVILLVVNEFIKDRFDNLKLNLSLYFLASFSFFIFFIPVLVKVMNTLVFLLSGFLSLAFILSLLYFLSKEEKHLNLVLFRKTGALLVGLFLFLNLLYFLNWIPPVPLSLKQGGIYHHVKKEGDFYKLQFEKGSWYEFFKDSDGTFHFSPGDTVFCFASVFAPTKLEKKIYFRWQFYNERKEEWQTTDRRNYRITGGRESGYRGYTYKRNLQPGDWRVDVETGEGALLGRISFTMQNNSAAGERYKLKTLYR